jgi:hypothetical protein
MPTATHVDTERTLSRSSEYEKKTWSELQSREKPDEKRVMARHCAVHDFLVSPDSNPEVDARMKRASILANNGTTSEVAVKECLDWVVSNYEDRGPFDLTWYTTGTLVPSTLKEYRDKYPHFAAAMHLFLFPGRVDQQMEAVSGPDPVDFAERMDRCFRYAFLGAHSFDMVTGTAYFHLPEEVRLQKAIATRYAAHKFLFFDSSKFKREGEVGYRVADILEGAEAATIYTVSSGPETDGRLKADFRRLCVTILPPGVEGTDASLSRKRVLRLVIVGSGSVATDRSCVVEGYLPDKAAADRM